MSILEMVSGDQLKRLGAGEIDIGLLPPPIPRTGLQFLRVKAEPMIAVVPAGHRLARAEVDLRSARSSPSVLTTPRRNFDKIPPR